ncbi:MULTISPECIES: hypothetical protein [Microbacterium]|uniref:hypothetical protein n=1 Tax=Microbacterium TaxID=33882 RepID=UPI00344B6DFA
MIARLVQRIGLPADITHFAPITGTTVAGEPIRPLRALRHSNADAVLVGGGDLLRLDTTTVALDHMAVPEAERHGFWVRLRVEAFRRRHYLRGPGVWLPQDDWITGVPTALVSVGARRLAPDTRVQAAVSRLKGVWARTPYAAHQIGALGLDVDRIVVAPDMIFAHPALSAQRAAAKRGRQIVRDLLDVEEPLVVFQAARAHGWPEARVEAVLNSLHGLPVAVLSLGARPDEERALTAAAQRTGADTLFGLNADEIVCVLAAAGIVFTTNAHAALVAGSFGTPVLVPSAAKTSVTFATCPHPPHIEGVNDADLAATVRARHDDRRLHDPAPNASAAEAAMSAILDLAGVV